MKKSNGNRGELLLLFFVFLPFFFGSSSSNSVAVAVLAFLAPFASSRPAVPSDPAALADYGVRNGSGPLSRLSSRIMRSSPVTSQ